MIAFWYSETTHGNKDSGQTKILFQNIIRMEFFGTEHSIHQGTKDNVVNTIMAALNRRKQADNAWTN